MHSRLRGSLWRIGNCDRTLSPHLRTMAHSVSAPDAATESLLRLVAEAGGVQHLNVTIDATSADVRFTAADGTPAFGAATACRWLASLGSAATQLLGETPEQAAKVRAATPNWGLAAAGGRVAASAAAVVSGVVVAHLMHSSLLCPQIAEWVSFRNALQPLMDAQLAELNEALASRTYIAGGCRRRCRRHAWLMHCFERPSIACGTCQDPSKKSLVVAGLHTELQNAKQHGSCASLLLHASRPTCCPRAPARCCNPAGGSRPSLADLVLYAAVAPAACSFPVAQHGHFCNLLRW